MSDKVWIIDKLVDKVDPEEGYDIVETTEFTNCFVACQEFNKIQPQPGEYFLFLTRAHNPVNDTQNYTALDCK